MSKSVYKTSPFGVAVFPHLSKPDIAFGRGENPLYHVKLALEGKEAADLKASISKAAQDAFDAFFENGKGASLSKAEAAKFTVYVPFEDETDKEGNPTGRTLFEFKQNARIKLKDGTFKDITIGIWDATGKKAVTKPVWGGSVIRIDYSMRPIPMASLKAVGVRLDFAKVQVKELATSGQGGSGFGAVEGYEEEGYEDAAPGTVLPSRDEDF